MKDTPVAKIRLVGVVTQNGRRKALVMEGDRGHIVKANECIGIERLRFDELLEGLDQPNDGVPLPANVAFDDRWVMSVTDYICIGAP